MSVFPVKMVVFTLEKDYPSEIDNSSYKSAKLRGKRQAKSDGLCPKLKPFHSQMETDYPVDTNYPKDITFEMDNLSLV